MPSRVNVGGIRMSVTSTCGRVASAPLDQLVVVGGHADHVQVLAGVDEGADAFAHDQVVVREENADRAVRACAVLLHVTSFRTPAGPGQ